MQVASFVAECGVHIEFPDGGLRFPRGGDQTALLQAQQVEADIVGVGGEVVLDGLAELHGGHAEVGVLEDAFEGGGFGGHGGMVW